MRNKYIFILTITFVCSIMLSVMYTYYLNKIDSNIELDRKKNILVCTSLTKNQILSLSDAEIEEEYKK